MKKVRKDSISTKGSPKNSPKISPVASRSSLKEEVRPKKIVTNISPEEHKPVATNKKIAKSPAPITSKKEINF